MSPIRRSIDAVKRDLASVRNKGSFARHAMQAFSGVALITLSQLVLTPIIARIYGPESYSIYGLFLALASNFALIAELGYTSAYVLPREEEGFLNLVRINLSALGVIVLLLVPICLAKDLVYQLIPDWSILGKWIYLLPIGVLITSLPILMTHWLTRAKAFGRSAYLGGATNVGLRLFNVGYGTAMHGQAGGLILGEVIVRSLSLVLYVRSLVPHGIKRLGQRWSRSDMWRTALEFKRYPLFIFPEKWVSLMGMQAPIYLLVASQTLVGKYTMASALLLMPLRLLGYSFSNVYLQKANESWQKGPAELGRVTWGLFQRLLLFGALPFAILTVFGDLIFSFFLGARWVEAGVMASLLGPFFFMRLLSEPIFTVLNVVRKEHLMIQFQSVLLLVRWGAMLAVLYTTDDPVLALAAFCVVSTIGQVVITAMLLHHAHASWTAGLLRALSVELACVALMMGLRFAVIGTWGPSFTVHL
jgi:O-antigen/teichoic acid export membrane protein